MTTEKLGIESEELEVGVDDVKICANFRLLTFNSQLSKNPKMLPSSHSDNYEIDVQALMRGLVHELRNPLSAVLTASSLVQSGNDVDEETTMLLDVIQKESRRMNRILTEFSNFVKPPKPQTETFDLGSLVCHVAASLQSDGAFEGVEFAERLKIPVFVQGDPAQTEAALRHILENSADALAHSGSLHVWSEEDGNQGCILIEDSGGRLSADILAQAFQPFFSTKPAATGLGLSIARITILAMDGDITIEAGENGARLRLCLPLANQSREENSNLQTIRG